MKLKVMEKMKRSGRGRVKGDERGERGDGRREEKEGRKVSGERRTGKERKNSGGGASGGIKSRIQRYEWWIMQCVKKVKSEVM